jgi:hypothetical protein
VPVSHFILSTICIAFANTLIEWFIIGFMFHKYQALTPAVWKAENNRSYTYSTLLSFLFGALFTIFYIHVGSKYVIPGNIWSQLKLALICFACFSFILEMSNAIYINYDKKFAAGKLIASCLNYIAATLIAVLFY